MNKFFDISESIKAGTKVFENQEILTSSDIAEKGLIFRNCKMNVTATISNCILEDCTISCNGLANCELVRCEISVGELGITNCKIDNPKSVQFDHCSVADCTFSNITGDNEGVIFPEDSKIINCRFKDIQLRNGAYLISGIGDCCISNCQFENCTTDRADLKITYCKDTVGKIIKKTKEYEIAEINCTGLDAITYAE